ncbi:hypothetical protein DXU06_27815 [Bradyrhizobium elkanii]|nr:hypothetical protein XI02_40205 [Bradyrhizobium sp. CCBAU 21365]BBB96564.1 hypothetical protein BE61_19950 [Bradyrhizobium elkanii USDA 61]
MRAAREAYVRVEQWRQAIDQIMVAECLLFANSVPRADHLSGPTTPLDRTYYLRHRIETVRRIWETARTDALALSVMVREDYEAARYWAEYLREEMNHDKLYLGDLGRHGISRDLVSTTPPFASTLDLIATLERRIMEFGSLPAVAYSVFVEWNSRHASPLAAARAAEAFGQNCVNGARAHIAIDERDHHDEMMLAVATRVMGARNYSTGLLATLLSEVGALLRAYFVELDGYSSAMSVRLIRTSKS